MEINKKSNSKNIKLKNYYFLEYLQIKKSMTNNVFIFYFGVSNPTSNTIS